MGYKMKGPSLYKPKMADMGIQKKYDKKADDRAMSSPYQKTTSGSDQEVMTKKKSSDTVVNSRTGVVSSVGTERLKAAGAPPEVIKASEAKFIKEQKAKNAKKNKA